MLMKQKQTSRPQFDRRHCVACTMCVDACPTGALGLVVMNVDKGSRRYPDLIHIDDCIGCGTCTHECPVEAIQMRQCSRRDE